MKIYRENISKLKAFYNSEQYKQLKGKSQEEEISSIVNGIYEDPDACDYELYQELGGKYGLEPHHFYLIDKVGDVKIRLSADAVCGNKQLMSLNNNEQQWLEDYRIIRSQLGLHFIWPRHQSPTINTLRYSKYLDRIDCLFFDLKKYFEGEETPMSTAYKHKVTALWLSKFKDFKDFVDQMKYTEFVNQDYEVLDIEQDRESILTDYIPREQLVKSVNIYLRNLIELYKN